MIPGFPVRKFWRNVGQGALYVAHFAFAFVLILAAASMALAGILYWVLWAGTHLSSSPGAIDRALAPSGFDDFWRLTALFSGVLLVLGFAWLDSCVDFVDPSRKRAPPVRSRRRRSHGGSAGNKPPLMIDVTPEKLPVPVKRRLR
jgi:hypothetical protein